MKAKSVGMPIMKSPCALRVRVLAKTIAGRRDGSHGAANRKFSRDLRSMAQRTARSFDRSDFAAMHGGHCRKARARGFGLDHSTAIGRAAAEGCMPSQNVAVVAARTRP
jgi:hypothetical protein